jgi:predicted lipoprotein with Yx(FWY)xxD motif
MGIRLRAVTLGVLPATLLAGTWVGTSAAFAASNQAPKATAHTAKNTKVFEAQHVAGVKGLTLVTGAGLVVYTYAGDTRGKAGTCTGACAAIWPPVRGVPAVARGSRIPGKFGRIDGQVTYNGWPLYLFTGEKARQDHADAAFKVIKVPAAPSHTRTASSTADR